MITIVNYGLGNVRAFANVYKRLNIETKFAQTAFDLIDVEKIILPGVGSYDHAMTLLNNSGMRDELDKQVLLNKVPVLGVCLGMQIMAVSSEEGKMDGLNWIEGTVKRFDSSLIPYDTKYPHMGWNTIIPMRNDFMIKDYTDKSRFYFLHSYYYECEKEEHVLTKTEYGINFTSAINKENIYGFQYHPEKSHQNGIILLKNFAEM